MPWSSVESKLQELGLQLPAPPQPVGAYVAVARVGNLLVQMKSKFGIELPFGEAFAKQTRVPTHVPLLLCGPKDQSHRIGQPLPIQHLGLQLLPALFRQPVELCFAPGGCLLPLGSQPSAILQAVKSGVERPLLELKEVARDLLDPLRDRVAMNRPQCDDLEDQHVQGALE